MDNEGVAYGDYFDHRQSRYLNCQLSILNCQFGIDEKGRYNICSGPSSPIVS